MTTLRRTLRRATTGACAGSGAELRIPLGISSLAAASQPVADAHTTPVIYLASIVCGTQTGARARVEEQKNPAAGERAEHFRPLHQSPVGTTLLHRPDDIRALWLTAFCRYPPARRGCPPSAYLPAVRVRTGKHGSSVAAPLERISARCGITEMTSTSGLVSTNIFLQFDITARGQCSAGCAGRNQRVRGRSAKRKCEPAFHAQGKPAAAPILTLALTSSPLSASAIFDAADTVVVQRISQVEGVGDVNVSGADQPAGSCCASIRIDWPPSAYLPTMCAMPSSTAMPFRPSARWRPGYVLFALAQCAANKRKTMASSSFARRWNGNKTFRYSERRTGVRNRRSDALFNGKPAVLLTLPRLRMPMSWPQ